VRERALALSFDPHHRAETEGVMGDPISGVERDRWSVAR
jgi:hypothetical protein